MRCCSLWLLAVLACWSQPTEVKAHFLFIRIGHPAEAGRAVEVYFSERAEAGDPRFVPKVAHTRLWMQMAPGRFQPLEVQSLRDRLRAHLPADGAVSVVGDCQYGVLQREVPFLLQYFPKALAGEPAELNRLKPRPEIPLEITALVKDDGLTLTVLKGGKPLPEATFTTVNDGLVNEELKADKTGRVTWKPPAAGNYCVYTRLDLAEPGELDGRKYTEIRRFATLAFSWPLVRSGADPRAVAMFERAVAARASWENFPGFTAEIDGTIDGRQFSGSVDIGGDGTVKLDIDEDAAGEWVNDRLESIVMHRQARSSSGRGGPVLRFADDQEDHPLGRLLTFVGGDFASSYRVQDDLITVVNRDLDRQVITITVLATQRNADAKILPSVYTVQYWDADDGKLLRTQTVQSRWRRTAAWDLPAELTVTTASSMGLAVRSFRLSSHRLLSKK